ncbi:MAG: GNAT family N-acetyltransferase [Clostridium sp.]
MISIQGKNIYLRTFSRAEYHKHWRAYVADPVMDPSTYVYNKESVDKKYDDITEKESWYPRLGVFLEDGTPIGEISIKRIDYEKSRCEFGIAIVNDNYKGLGYGTEAIELIIEYIFNTLKIRNIYADTMGSNLRMQRIFNKLGFGFINKEEQFYDMRDRWEDKLNYLLRNPKEK